jgi:hypothetical protein
MIEQMFDTLTGTRTELETLAGAFEPRTLTGEQAVRAVTELGAIRRLVDGMLGKAANRVHETSAHTRDGRSDRGAAQLVSRVVGADASEARRVMSTAKKLEQLPETDAAVRAGRLSARQAELVADAAIANPRAERDLLVAAGEGMVPLKKACVKARAHAEDATARAARHHAARRLRIWTAADGMVEGHFRLAPEVGGRFKAAVDAGTQRIFRARRAAGPHESHDAYAADVLADLVPGDSPAPRGAATGARGATITNVHVMIDHAALVRGNAIEGETCEIPGVGPVDVAWVREMLGEAFVTAVIRKGRDITTVAHFGRHIPAHLRTAMIVGGRECVVAGCHARGYLEIDHCEIDYANGGPAAWWNLDFGCSVHHRRKTRGWRLGPRDPKTGKRTLSAPDAARRAPPSEVSRR